MKAKITAKGQITLPASLRRQRGWRPGTVLEFEGTEKSVMVRETRTKRDPRTVIGCLKSDAPTGVMEDLDALRGAVEMPTEQ